MSRVLGIGGRSLRPSEWVALAVALFWSAALLLIATGVSVYEGTTVTRLGGTVHQAFRP